MYVDGDKYILDQILYEIEFLGWDRWEEEDYSTDEGIKVYAFERVHNGNSYMLTYSTVYTKIIVKGSIKELNKTLFEGVVSSKQELVTLMKQIGL